MKAKGQARFSSIEQILSASLHAQALLKTINGLAHSQARKHKLKQFQLKTKAEKQAYIHAEHEFETSLSISKTMSTKGAMKRLAEPRFWRKNIEKQVLKAVEKQAFTQKKLGHNRIEKCVSDMTMEFYDLKKEQSDQFLSAQELVLRSSLKVDNEENKTVKFNLLDAVNSSKTSRINELFLTLKSLEIIAEQQNKDWVFLTLTCPAEFHPNPTTSGNSYDPENDFAAAKEFLNKSLRSFFKYFDKKFKRGEDFFGIRVFEVHKDGCPHLHVLMFFDEEMREGIENKMLWLHEESGRADYFEQHKDNIVRFKSNNAGSAKASSYIYKYLTTALAVENEETQDLYADSATLEEIKNTEDKKSSALTAKRYKAAFRANSTRQYDFFGLKGSLTKRRALKKVTKMNYAPKHLKALANALHVDKGDENRLEKQLKASVAFIKHDNKSVQIIEEETTNSYGEKVKRVSEIKHIKDSESVKLSDRYYKLSPGEKQILESKSHAFRNITIRKILEALSEATISVNYSIKSQTKNKTKVPTKIQGYIPRIDEIFISLGDLAAQNNKKNEEMQDEHKTTVDQNWFYSTLCTSVNPNSRHETDFSDARRYSQRQ